MVMITLPWETWRAIVDLLLARGLPYMLVHARQLEQQLDQHGPDQHLVTLALSEDVYLRSYNWARLELGIPLPLLER